MSSFDRRALLTLLAAAPLAACGFTPVYAPGAQATALRGAVRMDDPETPDQFDIVREIEARFGRPTTPLYDLSITPRVTEDSLTVVGARDITRFNLIGTATYALRPVGSDSALLSGEVNSFTSYSATGTTVSTLTAERDARSRLMIILANLVVTRLLADADTLAQ
jgi:LPS-assembly lipoprotein